MTRRILLALAALLIFVGTADATPVGARRALLSGAKGPTLDLKFAATGTLDPRITFTRASGATYFDAAGVMQTAATNVPRFDFDPVAHAALGLRIEEQRQNVLLNSTSLSTQSVTTTAVAYTLSFYDTGSVVMTGACSAGGTLAGGGAFPARVTKTFTATAGTCTLTASGTVTDANLEIGSFATSYVTTAGAAATRAADVATMPVGPWFAPNAGTWVAEYVPAGVNANARVIGSNRSATPLSYSGLAATMYDEGAALTTANASVLGQVSKMASAWQGQPKTGAIVLNGGSPATGAQPTGAYVLMTTMYFMRDFGGTAYIDGTLSRTRYFPRALSAGQMQVQTR
jgi:hypothetical protein